MAIPHLDPNKPFPLRNDKLWSSKLDGCGTEFATAAAETLCRSEFAIQESDQESPTYAALTKCIHDILELELGVKDKNLWDSPSSPAQDDIYGSDHRVQSGTTLQRMEDHNNSLETRPQGEVQAGELSTRGSLILRDNSTHHDSIYEGAKGAPALERLSVMADYYKRSLPGNVESAANVAINSAIYRLQNPTIAGPMSDVDIRRLTSHLEYRNSMTKLATSYKNLMCIPFANCQDIDAGLEYTRLRKSKDEQASMHVKKCYDLVCKHFVGLFGEIREHRIPQFGKMIPYLALVLYSTKWTTDEMEAALVNCKQCKIDTSGVRRVITPIVPAQCPILEELVLELKDKRLRNIDSDPVICTPP